MPLRPTPSLPSTDRRTLTIGAAAVSCILLAGGAVPAWRAWIADAQAGSAELRAASAQAAAALRAYPAVRDSARARAERARVATAAVLRAPSAAAAGATLAERASAAATSADVRLGSLSLDATDARGCGGAHTPPSRGAPARHPVGGLATPCVHRVRLRTEITGDLRGFAVFLTLLERGEVHIAVPQLALAQPDPAAPSSRPETLRGTVTLEALAIEDVPDPGAPPAVPGARAAIAAAPDLRGRPHDPRHE